MEESRQAAKNCLKGIKKHGELWLKYEEESSAVVKSISNLLQQIQCCAKCNLEETQLFKAMPGVKNKLFLKLIKNVNPPLLKLRGQMDKMRLSCSRIAECCSSLQFAMQKHDSAISLMDLSQWTATSIPVTLLLLAAESLVDSMQQTLFKRECFLQSVETTVSHISRNSSEIFLEDWPPDCIVRNQLSEILHWCQFMV